MSPILSFSNLARIKTAILIIFVASIFLGCEKSIDISQYEGDGKIYKTGDPNFYPGYNIDFGKIDLTMKYEKSFKIKKLPEIDRTYSFGLFVKRYRNDLKKLSLGRLHYKLINSEGVVLFDCRDNLSKWIMTSRGSREETFFYYSKGDTDSSIVMSDKDILGEGSLIVKYEPVNQETNLLGEIQMRVGGTK